MISNLSLTPGLIVKSWDLWQCDVIHDAWTRGISSSRWEACVCWSGPYGVVSKVWFGCPVKCSRRGNKKSTCQGYRLTLFSPGARAPKTKWLGARLKTKRPRIRRKIKLILTPLPSICFTHTWSQRPSKSLFLNYLPIFGISWIKICKLTTASVRFDKTSYLHMLPFFQGQVGPLNI